MWHRYAYVHGHTYQEQLTARYAAAAIMSSMRPQLDYPLQPLRRYPVQDDALSTILSWLHWRMDDIQAVGGGGGVAAGHKNGS